MIGSLDSRRIDARSGPWASWEVVYSDFRRVVGKSLYAPAPLSIRSGDVYVILFLGHSTVQVTSLTPDTAPGGGLSWSSAPGTFTPSSWGCQAAFYAYSPDDTPRSVGAVATAGANFQIGLATFVIRGVRASAPASGGVVAGTSAATTFSGPGVTAAADALCVAGVRLAGAATLALSSGAVADGWVLTGAESSTAAMAAAYRIAPAGSVPGPEFTSTAAIAGAGVTVPVLHGGA